MQEGKPNRFKLIVFNLVKDHNVATLLRTAYAFGCDEVLVVGRKKFKFTGASGTYKFQSIQHFFSMYQAAEYCKQEGFAIYGLEIGGDNLAQTSFDRNIAFVVGNEGKGISDAEPFCERFVTIPQWGGVPSLNAAVAGGIVMYAFQSQQGMPLAEVQGQKYVDKHYDHIANQQ